MEKEGLMRGVKELEQHGLMIGTLVTDRHSQIAKWIRDSMSTTKHFYDVWHLAKGNLTLHVWVAMFPE